MRLSRFSLSTTKETPADAEIISHQLMLRSGMIRRLASGLYSWLPVGFRVLKKVETIVREEMNKSGALEILMPAVQPAELWQESGRWDQYGPELLRVTDRHQREFCIGPTHEEIITDIARRELTSYKQLPAIFYQVQTKFRDEIRPRFGIMRSREFIMKDAYSFHSNEASLQETYDEMYSTYSRIFTRLGLEFRAVMADSGAIGGSRSHEFHVLADSGEDAIVFSDNSDYAANIEKAETAMPTQARKPPQATMETVDTPSQHTIAAVSEYLGIYTSQCLKTLLVVGAEENSVVALVLRGDHELNEIKATALQAVASPLQFASEAQVISVAGCTPGSVGPVGLTIPLFADHSALIASDFVCGANSNDQHLRGVNWKRDLPEAEACHLRNIVEGDISPDGKGTLSIARGIEVGHIFQLGTKYSTSMNASVLDENGKSTTVTMGCYGIGVTRIVAAAVEQNHDDNGIIWPDNIAPFVLAIAPINYQKSDDVREFCDQLYAQCQQSGIEVLLYDEKTRLGAMLADLDLIGIPHRIVVGDRGLKENKVEYKHRRESESRDLSGDDLFTQIKKILHG